MRFAAIFAVLVSGALPFAGAAFAGEHISDAVQITTPQRSGGLQQTARPDADGRRADDALLRPAGQPAKQCGHPKRMMKPHAAASEDEYQGSPDWEVGEELC